MVTSTDQPTDQQVIGHLATKVMGLHNFQDCWHGADGDCQALTVASWNPLIKDHDAMQVVDAMVAKGWNPHLFYAHGVWTAVFFLVEGTDKVEHYVRASGSFARAISMAASEATKEEE